MLERLPREQREAIAAHVVAGHGYRDIARRTGLSEAGVRQRVSRGLATMRRPAQVRLAAERVLDETLTYSLGAGHDVPLEACAPSRGLDCSSYVSLTLRRTGLLASERALTSREIASDWGVAGEGDHLTVWAGAGHAWLEFKLAGEHAERLQVGPTRPSGACGWPHASARPRVRAAPLAGALTRLQCAPLTTSTRRPWDRAGTRSSSAGRNGGGGRARRRRCLPPRAPPRRRRRRPDGRWR